MSARLLTGFLRELHCHASKQKTDSPDVLKNTDLSGNANGRQPVSNAILFSLYGIDQYKSY